MATTASMLRSATGVNLFYYLKVTGIPYYFFGVIDPTDAVTYDTDAWILPDGFTAVQGLDLPDDSLEQKLPDLVGGIASAERIRLTLRDFNAQGATGAYPYLSRLFAPGRLSLATPIPEMSQPLISSTGPLNLDVMGAGAGNTVGGSTPWIAYVGGEAIEITAPVVADSGGNATLLVSERNMFPCTSVGYPPIPYHMVATDKSGAAIQGRNILVATEPYTLIGRTAALYVGHIANERPCLEGETLMRLVGRITAFDTGDQGGQYELAIESVMADLDKAKLGAQLMTAEISRDQIYIQGDYCYATFGSDGGSSNFGRGYTRSAMTISVSPGVYTIESLVNSVNQGLLASPLLTPAAFGYGLNCYLFSIDGIPRVAFTATPTSDFAFWIRNGRQVATGANGNDINVGLLSALGFDDTGTKESQLGLTVDNVSGVLVGPTVALDNVANILAEHTAPSVFIPFDPAGRAFNVNNDAFLFFNDQGDGSDQAFVRFSDGQIARTTSAGVGVITVADQPSFSIWGDPKPDKETTGANGYFRCDRGKVATVEQVILAPPTDGVAADPGTLVGRFIASTGEVGGGGSVLDVYPQGVGLGLDSILDADSFLAIPDDGFPRATIVDSRTTLADLFMPIAKEYGLMLVWDPELAQIAVRQVRIPAAPNAHAISLTESNRSEVKDRTRMIVDQSSVRSSWTLKWGWSRFDEKFLASPISVVDAYVLSAYGQNAKGEAVEDRTLVWAGNTSGLDINTQIFTNSYLYRQPWLRAKRTMTKAGLLLAPGTCHQIVDNTIVNPFTGLIGVTAADRIFVLLTGVTMNPATGIGDVDYVVNRQDPSSVFRTISPCALLDFGAASHGYNNATGVVTLVSHYASDGAGFDGIDFVVGDTVTLVDRDADGTPTFEQNSTISAVAVDGHTVTVASGLGTLSTTSETVMILRDYTNSTTARKAATAYQGSQAGEIQATVPDHRWL